jgi:hypothetical protein
MGMIWGGNGIDCTMRILDVRKQIARFFAWEVRVNGVVVGDLGLAWLGVFVVLVLALALAATFLLFGLLSIRRGDSGIGLDFSCTYTRMRSLALFLLRGRKDIR